MINEYGMNLDESVTAHILISFS